MNSRRVSAKVAIAGLLVAGFALSSCSAAQEAVNRGGDTPCSDFIAQDSDTQRVTVTKWLKNDSSDGTEPSGMVVDGTIVAVGLLCKVQSNADVPIRKADLGGVVAPK